MGVKYLFFVSVSRRLDKRISVPFPCLIYKQLTDLLDSNPESRRVRTMKRDLLLPT